jgi:adenylosuccinate lyase
VRYSINAYCSKGMNEVWSPTHRVKVERHLWVLVMELQQKCGVEIPTEAIADYRRVCGDGDLNRICEIELETRHDLRARLQHFNEQAGHNYAHWGLTSCDITDNATQLQIRQAIGLLYGRVVDVLDLLRSHIEATRDTVAAARTHGQLAQVTLLGKRFATVADELLSALSAVKMCYNSMPCRGLVGAIGTAQDLVQLVGAENYQNLQAWFVDALEFDVRSSSLGQVYPRSDDSVLCSAVAALAAAPANLARLVRLEASHGRMWERFTDTQIGSSAMPHKCNPVTAERINGLVRVSQGYNAMIASTSGEQWWEGDVSDSVTRRIGLPGLFKAVDAVLLETNILLTGLDLDRSAYVAEVHDNLTDLNTGRVLSAALLAGADRDEAYEALRDNRVMALQGDDSRLGLTRQQILDAAYELELPAADAQIDEVLEVIKGAIGQTG